MKRRFLCASESFALPKTLMKRLFGNSRVTDRPSGDVEGLVPPAGL